MASPPSFTSSLSGATQIQTCSARHEIVLNSARLGMASPSAAHLRAALNRPRRAAKISRPSFHVACKTGPSEASVLKKDKEEKVSEEEISPFTPSTLQVQSLLTEICDGTSIAELKLKVGTFLLHVKRDVGKVKAAPAPPSPVPMLSTVASSNASVATLAAPATPPTTNTHANSILPATVSKTASLFGLLEAAADQGLSFVTSPKVGVFRRGRNVKGKFGKPLVEEGVIIKEGQVVGYLEQLGTQQPVEAQVSGEVVQVLWEDGESVGYGDPLISIRPFFPGIVSRAALN